MSTTPFPQSETASRNLQDTAHRLDPGASALDRRGRVVSPPPELSLIAFQGDICFAFMFSNFVWRSYGSLWLESAASGKLGDLALDATKALSRSNFGKSNHQSQIELQGVLQYGQCLNTLAKNLASHRNREKRDLLVPILVLLMHAVRMIDLAWGRSELRCDLGSRCRSNWICVSSQRNCEATAPLRPRSLPRTALT